jgi:hypothetical protein
LTVEALDKKGWPVLTASNPIDFRVSGDGALIDFGNDDTKWH